MMSKRLRHAAQAIAELAGSERAIRGYDLRSDALAHKLMLVVDTLLSEAAVIAAVETHLAVPKTARAGLSVVTGGDAA